MLSDVNNEYQSREAELLDGWRGTIIGVAVVIILGLAFREFFFSRAYLGSAGLVGTGIKVGVAITFAISLFIIKDAIGYNQLEKIRFVLFLLMLSCVACCWFLAWSNRIFPAALENELVEVEIVRLKNSKKIGADDGKLAHVDAAVMLTEQAEKYGYQGSNGGEKPAATGPGNRITKNKYPTIRIDGPEAGGLEAGAKITARLYHGRWGQDFILAAE